METLKIIRINVINPAFTVKKQDIKKAKEILKTGQWKIKTKRVNYWALALQMAMEEILEGKEGQDREDAEMALLANLQQGY